jgi:transcriptional regulator with XRE-family HTH domain
MNQQTQLLDAARKKLGCNDRELADRLGTGKARISEYRRQHERMTDAHAAALAKLADLDQAQVIAALHAERAAPELREIWKEIARRSAVFGLALGILGGGATCPGLCKAEYPTGFVYYVKLRIRQILRGLTPSVRRRAPT